MSRSDNVMLVKSWFERLEVVDYEGMDELHTDDIEWDVLAGGSEGVVPWVGRYRGRAGVRDCLRRYEEAVRSERFEILEFLGNDDRVAAVGHVSLVARHNGKEFGIDFVEYFRLRNQKISYVRVYGDTVAAYKVFREKRV